MSGGFVFLPSGSRNVASHHAFHGKHFRPGHDHGAATELIGILLQRCRVLVDIGSNQVVRNQVTKQIEPEKRNLCKHPALVRDAGGQDVIEGGDAVGGDEQQALPVQDVHVAHFAAGVKFKFREVCLQEHRVEKLGVHH